ncbi:MAG: aldehyde dehydrogenase family protein [bacterium]|nr:aldehyde dehydrogenase family protein [bacterium]MDE0418837.1 aldehyde dehydrogenase family protein [bacterium]
MVDQIQMNHIGGKPVAPATGTFLDTIDPATEEPLARFARSVDEDVDAAVQAAHLAQHGDWSTITPADRGRILERLAGLIENERENLARLETLDAGKPIDGSRGDIDGVVETLRYNAGAADKMEGITVPLGRDIVDFTVLEPLGVTAHIVPWNFPLGMAIRSLAPALAAGCTCVLKPAEQSPLSALAFAELAEQAGIPDGVVNIVTGLGEEAGEALVRHPLVRGITFTGSVETGRRIMSNAAQGIKPVVLELGGKNPMIILADADLDRAVDDALVASFDNTGQVCSSSSRYLLAPAIREDFIERLCAGAASLSIGPGLENPSLGPVISSEQYARVRGHIDAGVAAGGRIRQGGSRPQHLDRGYFIEPTVFDRVSPDMAIAQEEVFGPVGVAVDIEDADQAVAVANSLGFGLAAGVYTRDISRALNMAQQLEAGSVWINGWFMGGVQAPTGGMKESGIGRERGLAGVRNYLAVKNVAIRL